MMSCSRAMYNASVCRWLCVKTTDYWVLLYCGCMNTPCTPLSYRNELCFNNNSLINCYKHATSQFINDFLHISSSFFSVVFFLHLVNWTQPSILISIIPFLPFCLIPKTVSRTIRQSRNELLFNFFFLFILLLFIFP